MARRARLKHELQIGDSTTLGKHFSTVVSRLEGLHTKLASLITYDFQKQHSLDAIVNSLFKPDALSALITAAGITNAYKSVETYKFGPGTEITIQSFDKLRMLPPNQAQMLPMTEPGPAKLQALVQQLGALHYKASQTEHVLAWLDNKASAAAIRHWWPAILSIMPDCLGEAPPSNRHVTPEGISDLLPSLRETAEHVAALMLMPGDMPKAERLGITVMFDTSMGVNHRGAREYKFRTRQRSFYL